MIGSLALLMLIGAAPLTEPVEPAPPPPQGTEIVIRPATEPRPALKYRLLPERRTQVPGNAALFYHRALQMYAETRANWDRTRTETSKPDRDSIEIKISQWGFGPVAAIPGADAQAVLNAFQSTLKELEVGTQRRDCDWGLDDRTEGVSLLIPEIQNSRSLARLVRFRAMVAIRDGQRDEALHWIEVGMTLGRHVNEGPTLIQGLVGMAIIGTMNDALEALIQVPGMPSLYWALADRPRPFLDLRRSMEEERFVVERELPLLTELDRGPWSQTQTRQFAVQFNHLMNNLVGIETLGRNQGATFWRIPSMSGPMSLAVIAARTDAETRRALIADGMPEAEVAALPVIQASVLRSYRKYEVLRDHYFKRMALPFGLAFAHPDPVSSLTVEQKQADLTLALLAAMLPAVDAGRQASVRSERRLEALQVIEAIRLYAHSHDGLLPSSLGDLVDHPAPLDPSSGKPFDYRLDRDTATLSSPAPPGSPDHPAFTLRYTLKRDR